MIWLLAPVLALAEVPYGELERLRQLTIVTRVILDQPEGRLARECALGEDSAMLGSNLQLTMDDAAAEWGKRKILEEDLSRLKVRVARCEQRGSCQVYEAFVSAAKAGPGAGEEVEKLKTNLGGRLSTLESSSFEKALESVRDPCALATRLLKN